MSAARTAVLPPALPVEPVLTRAPSSLWRDAWRRMLRNKFAMVGLTYVVLLIFVAFFANYLAPYPYEAQDFDSTDQGPSPTHIFGTDAEGRDLFSRMVYGSRISLAVAIVDVVIVLAVGVPLGLAAGYFGGWLDSLVMRTVDILFAFPNLLLIIVVITFVRALLDAPQTALSQLVGPLDKLTGGLIGVFIALGLVSWLTVGRLVRGQVLSLKEKEYIDAARTVGAPDRRIMLSHLLPNVMAPIIISATFGIPGAIANEAGLSFLGLGVRPPLPSWGILISDGVRAMRTFPHELLFPAGILAITLICFNFLGDGLRDALDPKMKQ
jgi:ABC-type dipeptide/oligopeptide/nickel transport system permease subunit